jgi:hypothetical protein
MTMFADLAQLAHQVGVLQAAQRLTHLASVAPPGSDKLVQVLGYINWGAIAALLLEFFSGVLVLSGGRWVDHHRAGRVGGTMIVSALCGGLLYGLGYTMIAGLSGLT